jgi:hypothetical protein
MLAVIPGGGALGAGIKDARAAVTVGKDLKVLGGVTEAAAKEGGAGKAAGEVCNLFNSFTPDTPVLLASGKKVRIDQVKVGDKVLAQDPKTSRQAPEPVERIIIGQGIKHLVAIAIPGETIVATDAHPFYVRQPVDFVTAGQLQAGDQLELSTGGWVTIASIQRQDQTLRVYNLSVGEMHTFFAGDASVLVHNCGGGYPRDFPTANTNNWSAEMASQSDARALARTKIGRDPVEVEPYKWRSVSGKWQYRAKPEDVALGHVHLEELNPETGEVLQNVHLTWP